MTVQTQTVKVTGLGNGSARAFSFSPMVLNKSSEVVVTKVDTAGAETLLTEGTSSSTYSVTVGEFPGTGSVNYPHTGGTLLASGESIIMKRVLTLEQQLDLDNQGGYLPETLEDQLDKLVMLDLQQQEELDRIVKLPVSASSSFDANLPAPIVADRLIGIASDGLSFEYAALAGTLPDPVTVLKGGTGATTAPGALTALGAAGLAATTYTGTQSWDKGADIASATALVLGTDGNSFDVTGTTTITSITSVALGTLVILHFDGILTLTHSAADLVLPGGANIVTAAGDMAIMYEYASGDWRCVHYQRGASVPQVFKQGADVSSASPCVLGVDGNYFDVTGTTGFSAFTVTAGAFFMVQFDGALVLTHGASLDLPGEANITTAAGDRLIGFATAANTVQVLSYFKASGRGLKLAAPNFTSAEQTVTADTILDVAHSLGVIPTLVQVVLRCTTTDLGYAVGDEVVYSPGTGGAGSSTDGGATIYSDATNVSLVQGLDIPLQSQSTFNGTAITVGSWKWVVRAWV